MDQLNPEQHAYIVMMAIAGRSLKAQVITYYLNEILLKISKMMHKSDSSDPTEINRNYYMLELYIVRTWLGIKVRSRDVRVDREERRILEKPARYSYKSNPNV